MIAAVVFLGGFLLYLRTLCGSYDIVDGAELLSVGSTLGVAHPPGYPLLALLGRLCFELPVGSPCFRIQLLAPVAGAAACAGLFRIACRWSDRFLAGILVVIMLCQWTFWSQCLGMKGAIFLVHICFVLAVFFLLSERPAGHAGKIALVAGLAFANHVQGAAIFAVSLIAVLAVFRSPGSTGTRSILLSLVLAALGLSIYLYLPLRSQSSAPVCWGILHRLPSLLGTWRWGLSAMHSHRGGWGLLEAYSFKGPFTILLALAVAGNLLGLRDTRLQSACAVSFLSSILTLLIVLPHDIFDGYMQRTLVVWAWGLTGALGVAAWAIRAFPVRGRLTVRLAFFAALVLSFAVSGDRRWTDRSRYYCLDDFVRNVLGSASPGKCLLLWFGDYDYDAARFRQLVLHERPEIAHVHVPIVMVPAYGDHLAALAREHAWLKVPSGRPATAGGADQLVAELVKINRASFPVFAEASFLGDQGTWPAVKSLRPVALGFAAAFSRRGTPRESVREFHHGRFRGLWERARTRDLWHLRLLENYRNIGRDLPDGV